MRLTVWASASGSAARRFRAIVSLPGLGTHPRARTFCLVAFDPCRLGGEHERRATFACNPADHVPRVVRDGADDHGHPRFDDAGLFERDIRNRGPEVLLVVE